MGTVSSSLRTAMVLISYDDSKTFFMEYTPYGFGVKLLLLIIQGKFIKYALSFEGGMLQKIVVGNLTSCID